MRSAQNSHPISQEDQAMLADSPIFPSLPAHDIERAKAWYKDKLGLTPIRDLGGGGQLYTSGKALFVVYQSPFAGTGKHTLAAFVVGNIDETMTELRAKGVKFEDYAMGDKGPTTENGVARDPDGGSAAWFTDSEGNILNLVQLPPGMDVNNPAG
jgi:catechol 2,3-dioxygenase-like lactoylglutathione lyase family enzyme